MKINQKCMFSWVSVTRATLAFGILAVMLPGGVYAQAPAGGRGGGPPQTAKAAAPVDFTGYWVSFVTEDWRYRMLTPPKGDYIAVPLNAEGKRVADTWDPDKDTAAGEQCRSYGAAAIMRVPEHVHITWQDDNTLKIETDAGQQTRLFHFQPGQAQAAGTATGPRSWQGTSTAEWVRTGAAGGRGGGRGNGFPVQGSLKVVTTNMKAGYLRKNGVPYSENAVLTEYYDRTIEAGGDSWMFVTTIVQDPKYLNQPFITSSNFKSRPDESGWDPQPCAAK